VNPLTHDDIAQRYPQTLEYCGATLHRVTVANLEHIDHIKSAGVWYYFPLRAADNLDCLKRVVSCEPIDHSPPCDFMTLQNGQTAYIQTDDFVYVDETTLARIQNYV
jgi:hypothetical protein